MKLIFISYISSPEYNHPKEWLKRIEGYIGILENLTPANKVISIERINYEGEYQQNGVQCFFIRLKRKIVRFPFRMHRLIKNLQPDVVFVNGFIFPLQIIQLRLKLGRSVKIVVLHRAEKPFNGFRKYLQKQADKCVNGYLFTSSEFGNEWLQKGIISSRHKIHEVIQASSSFHPEDKTTARASLSVTGAPVFLWVGRLDANKDPITVIKAFIDSLSFQPSARLYMIYQAEELLAQARYLISLNSKAKEAIRLIGQIPHEQLQSWYSSADFIISGSHYEGSGVAVSEAMSCGCIPIITNIASFRRMTGPGKCGLLYEPGNDKELLEILLQTNELDREQERGKVLKQFGNELSFEAIARKINGVIGSG